MLISFYDTEVKESPEEVGWKNYGEMGMSVGCVITRDYDIHGEYKELERKAFYIPKNLVDKLNQSELSVGFNNIQFDRNLLCHFTGGDQEFILKEFDMMANIDNEVGYKYSTNLDDLAYLTIGEGKSGDGAHAPKLYQAGKIDELTNYCFNDVEITANVFDFGVKYGYVNIYPGKNHNVFGDMVLRQEINWKRML